VTVTIGSTTIYGNGPLQVSLPVPEAKEVIWLGKIYCSQLSTGAAFDGVAFLAANESTVRFWAKGNNTSGGVTANFPFAWKTDDVFVFTITYAGAPNN
jgi:hypothetical protein